MTHAYVPARVWPSVYLGHSWAAKKRVDATDAAETTVETTRAEARRAAPHDSNLGWNNPDWWVSRHYE